jgi:nitrite reductase/ring-hydroxylating ferredoxin subunit
MARTIQLPNVTPPTEGKAIRVTVEGTPVAVFLLGTRFYALDASCTHMRGPLDRGMVKENSVRCPWHGSVFSLQDGKVLQGPASQPVRAYRARFDDSTLVLETD